MNCGKNPIHYNYQAGVLVVVVVAILTFFAVLVVFDSNQFYFWQPKRMVKRVLASDPEKLRSAGRQLLHHRSGFTGELSPWAPEVPNAIRRLGPTRIWITTNCVSVDFSDAFNPFGILVYHEGAEGSGPHKWIDGLWLYDDGQLDGAD